MLLCESCSFYCQRKRRAASGMPLPQVDTIKPDRKKPRTKNHHILYVLEDVVNEF
jgi:hypothetical protein